MPLFRPHNKQVGFTLLEVLIAIAILSIGMLAVISTVGSNTRDAIALKQKTYAHWIAMNEATRLRTQLDGATVGQHNGKLKFANTKWHWEVTITTTSVASIKRADITVSLASAPKDVISSLIVFLGRHHRVPQTHDANATS